MSKSTHDTAFRKVDVSPYSDGEWEYEIDEVIEQIAPDEQTMSEMQESKQYYELLEYILSNAPVNTKNQATKDAAFGYFMRAITSCKPTEVDVFLNKLDIDNRDMLVKYIYRGFAQSTDSSSAVLLNWFEKVFKIGGYGCINRVLTDRKRI